MSEVITDFGKVEYEPAWLEEKLEKELALERQLILPESRLDMRDWPDKVYLCRYRVSSQAPFQAVIYSKETITEHYQNRPISKKPTEQTAIESDDVIKILKETLGNPQYLLEEVIRFALQDGIVTIRHEHQQREVCDDNAFTVLWGGGDLSACPCVVQDQKTRYDREGIVRGRKECLYALKAVIKGGGL